MFAGWSPFFLHQIVKTTSNADAFYLHGVGYSILNGNESSCGPHDWQNATARYQFMPSMAAKFRLNATGKQIENMSTGGFPPELIYTAKI